MFKIYIYDYAENYNVTTGQYTLVSNDNDSVALSIPVNSKNDIWMLSPIIKGEVNKAESFDFTVEPGTIYYNAFIPFKTWLRVTYENETIFWGRVKTVNNSNYTQKRSIHAEGVYSLLCETPVEGLEEDLQDSMTASECFAYLLDNHNRYIEEDKKKFCQGNIGVILKTTSKKRRPTGWSMTVNELDKLVDEHGGLIRARYNADYKTNGQARNYIDWARYFFRDLGEGIRPTIKLARNLIDISKNAANNDIFTRLIPIGHKEVQTTTSSSKTTTNDKNRKDSAFVYIDGPSHFIKIIDVPGLISNDINVQRAELEADGFRKIQDFTDAERNYGVIYKTQNFSNASSSSELQTYALDWIKHNYYGIVQNFSIKAIDMHMLGESESQILVGDCVDVTYPEYDNDGTQHLITRKLICKAVQYNLFNPEANTYTFGVPCDAIDFEYGEKSKKKSNSKTKAQDTAASRSPGGGGGGGDTTITWGMVRNWLRTHYYACDHKNIVDWTETRWTTFWPLKPGATDSDPLLYIYDEKPYNTFSDNKEFVTIKSVPAGVDGDGNQLYATENVYTYANFTRPDSNEVVRGRILGHYEINKNLTKPAQVAKNKGNKDCVNKDGKLLSYGVPIDSTKKYGSVYHYGVCVTSDNHVYTFHWPSFAATYGTHYGEETLNEVFNTYFEIAKTSSNGTIPPPAAAQAATGDDDGEKIGPVVWKNHDGKTTAEIASEEGWSTFGLIEDDEGNLVPAVKLNDTVTYTDADNKPQTKSGFVTAQDLNLPETPSFRTKIAIIDNAIIERASIMELRAVIAELGGDTAYGSESYEIDPLTGKFVETTNENGEKKWKLREGTKFVTNSRNVIAASGVYGTREVIDEITGRPTTELYIKDGAGFSIEKGDPDNPGRKAYFGVYHDNNLTAGIIAKKINNDYTTFINGDHINIGNENTKRVLTEATNELGQVVGTYVWETDSSGKKIRIKGLDGSGSYVWKDGAAYGLWHEGNLDGGILVKKINDETTTQIKGTRIKIGDKGTKSVSLTDAITINSEGFLTSTNSMFVKGDLSVAKGGSGSGGTLRASNITIGLEGSLTFDAKTGSSSRISVTGNMMSRVFDTNISHVKVTGPNANGEYTLWYLPASSVDTPANWKDCGNFSKATSNVVVNWTAGSSVDSPAHMYVTANGIELYKARIGGNVPGYDKYLGIIIDDNEETYAYDKYVEAIVHLRQGELQTSNQVVYTTDLYKTKVYVNATPVYNNGHNDGYDFASGKAKIEYISSDIMKFTYPSITKTGNTKYRTVSEIRYVLRSDNNDAYLSTQIPGSMALYDNKLTIHHGRYDAGQNDMKSVMYARFAMHNGYCIEPYIDANNKHSTDLSDGLLRYSLGFIGNDTRRVYIKSGENRIPNTPSFEIKNQDIFINQEYINSGYYRLSSIDQGKGASYLNASIVLTDLNTNVSSNNFGQRNIHLSLKGYGSFDAGYDHLVDITTLYKTIWDYKDGYNQGKQDLINQGYKKFNHATWMEKDGNPVRPDGGSAYLYTYKFYYPDKNLGDMINIYWN